MADGNNRITPKQVCKDFLRFLKTDQVDIDGMQKSVMKSLFEKQYLTYRKQIFPLASDKLPNFHSLLWPAKRSGMFYTSAGKVYLFGPRSQRTAQNAQGSLARAGRSNSESNTSLEHSPQANSQQPEKKQRKRRGKRRAKLAVDQHLTFQEKLAPLTKDIDESIDVTDYLFIEKDGRMFYCSACKTKMTSKGDTIQHVKGKRHRLGLCVSLLQKKKNELLKGQLGVTVSSNSEGENGTYNIKSTEKVEQLTDLTVTNYGDLPVELVFCEMMRRCRVFKLMDQKRVTDGISTVTIQPGNSYRIQVRLLANYIGSYHCPVMFNFAANIQDSRVTFFMVRYLHGRCTNSIVDELKPVTRYKRPPQVARMAQEDVEMVPGIKPMSNIDDQLEKKIGLKDYKVPLPHRKMINRGLTKTTGLSETEQLEMENLKSILEAPIDMKNYQLKFDTLLYLEEVQMEVDIRKYDMENVTMKVFPDDRKLLLLAVPGLAEKRPSVLKGDWLYVRIHEPGGRLSKKEYQGYVHRVLLNEVALGFDNKFRSDFMENQKFKVRFVVNRLPIRSQHRACELAKELTLDKILFPDNPLHSVYQLPQLKLYNRILESNEQQMCAVQHIVAGTSRPAPYIVFGPPGTGKTVTIVEAIKQVWKQSKDTHILACTPSNSASDLITSRLVNHIPKSDVLRLNAKSRPWISVPDDIKDVCNYDRHDREFYIPSKTKLSEYRIIVCTLVTAGRLVSANFPQSHFSHVFIDEAGHAVEPEALIALAGIMEVTVDPKKMGQVVLAGDPKQLGPVLRSPLAIRHGLNISILERLMTTIEMYKPKTSTLYERIPEESGSGDSNRYDGRVITKLLKNYRSHEAILKLPNEMFYDNELVPCASLDRNKLCHWEELPKKNFPVLFHGVIGEDLREEKSPSFFNAEEVALVVSYVEKLMTCRTGGINLRQSDIGVISPYRKQVEKISKMLKKKKFDKISVGSVEEFQGAERTVIIVSTVRSKPEYMSFDLQFSLGFLRNPKRFNVTVTRPKALLIVIGNPNTLSGDYYWKSFIDYCEENDSVVGVNVGQERMTEDDLLEDISQRLQQIKITDDQGEILVNFDTELSEQSWRHDL